MLFYLWDDFFRKSASTQSVSSDLIIVEDEPEVKRKKVETEKSSFDSVKLSHIEQKVVKDVNLVLEMTDFEGRITAADVKASTHDGKLAVLAKCLLCISEKFIAMHCTKYSTDCSNFKRHLARFHLVKGAKLEPGVKIKQDDQRTITTFYQPEKKSSGNATETSEANGDLIESSGSSSEVIDANSK